jgi:hypothetical protein
LTEWYETPATARGTTFQNWSISVDEMWCPELGFAASSIRLFSPGSRMWMTWRRPAGRRDRARGDGVRAPGDGREATVTEMTAR